MTTPVLSLAAPTTFRLGLYTVVRRERRVLLVRYANGLVGLPGGRHTDPLRPVEQSLRDQLRGLTGIAIDRFELLGSYAFAAHDGVASLNLVFLTDYVSGIVNGDAATVQGFEWVTLPELLWHPDATELTREAARHLRSVMTERLARP